MALSKTLLYHAAATSSDKRERRARRFPCTIKSKTLKKKNALLVFVRHFDFYLTTLCRFLYLQSE